MSQSDTESHRVSQGVTECHRVSQREKNLDLNLSLLKTTKTATKKKTLFSPPQARMKRRKGVK